MKLTLALLLSAFTFTASAQESTPESNVFVTYLDVNCFKDATPMLQELTAKYGEKPLFAGKSPLPVANFYSGEPNFIEGVTMMYVNQDTGTFTNVMLFADGSGCQVLFGEEFTPAVN